MRGKNVCDVLDEIVSRICIMIYNCMLGFSIIVYRICIGITFRDNVRILGLI
jgi:hypothetical protein